MTNEDVYIRWRDAAGVWAQWIKPSLMTDASSESATPDSSDVSWLPKAGDCALVIDLPNVEAVALGAALAAHGYCPVPMFNTTWGISELVKTRELSAAVKRALRHWR